MLLVFTKLFFSKISLLFFKMSSIVRTSIRRSRRRMKRRTSSLTSDGVLVRYALRQGTVESVGIFFSGKLQRNLDLPLPDGQLPLHVAVDASRDDVVLFLLNKGADINMADPAGWTALHRAVYNGNIPLVKLLLDHGADASLRAGHLLASDLAMDCDNNMATIFEEAERDRKSLSTQSEEESDDSHSERHVSISISVTDDSSDVARATERNSSSSPTPDAKTTNELSVTREERKAPKRSFSLRRSIRKHTSTIFKGVARKGTLRKSSADS